MQLSPPLRSLTHTHLFPFPLRQLCCSLSIVEASHFHMCVGHKTAKSRLKASLSWLAGSQFVSYKHRTHLSPTVLHISFWPPYLPIVLFALLSTGTGFQWPNGSKAVCLSLIFSFKKNKQKKLYKITPCGIVINFLLTLKEFFEWETMKQSWSCLLCLPTCLALGFPSIVMTTVCTHRHWPLKTIHQKFTEVSQLATFKRFCPVANVSPTTKKHTHTL